MIDPKDEIRLRHMRDAAGKAVRFTHGRGRTDLDTDEVLALAIVRLLEIVGEAAKAVGAETRAALNQVPWKPIAGTRDRLVHGYFDVDLDIVWTIVTADLPPLLIELEKALEG